MALEIERKFLVDKMLWKPDGPGAALMQGYIFIEQDRQLRVRIKGARAFMTVKLGSDVRIRSEFEYEIPTVDAEELLIACGQKTVSKTRLLISALT